MSETAFTLRVAAALTRQTALDLGRVGYLLALLERASNTDPSRVRAICTAAGVDPRDVGVVEVGSLRGLCRLLGLVSARGNPSTARARTLLDELGDLRLAAPVRVGGRLFIVVVPPHIVALDPHATRAEREARVEWAHRWKLGGEAGGRVDHGAIGGDHPAIALPLYRDRREGGVGAGAQEGALGVVGQLAAARHGGALAAAEVDALGALVAEHGEAAVADALRRGDGRLRAPARWLRVVLDNAPRPSSLEQRIVAGIPRRRGRAPVEALSPRQREQLVALVAAVGEAHVEALVDDGVGVGCDWPVRALVKHVERLRRPQAAATARPSTDREAKRREWVRLGATTAEPLPSAAAPPPAPPPAPLPAPLPALPPAPVRPAEVDARADAVWRERRGQLAAEVVAAVVAAGLVAVGADGDVVLLDGEPDAAAAVATAHHWPLRAAGVRVRRPDEMAAPVGPASAPSRMARGSSASMAQLVAAVGGW